MTSFAKTNMRNAAVAAVLLAVSSSVFAVGPAAAAKYDRHTVTKKASFHTLKKNAKHLDHKGIVKVQKIKRHGRVIGFKKTLAKSGDKVIVKRGRHGKVIKTTLKKRSFLRRWKGKFSKFVSRRHRGRLNGFRRH